VVCGERSFRPAPPVSKFYEIKSGSRAFLLFLFSLRGFSLSSVYLRRNQGRRFSLLRFRLHVERPLDVFSVASFSSFNVLRGIFRWTERSEVFPPSTLHFWPRPSLVTLSLRAKDASFVFQDKRVTSIHIDVLGSGLVLSCQRPGDYR